MSKVNIVLKINSGIGSLRKPLGNAGRVEGGAFSGCRAIIDTLTPQSNKG